MFLLPVNCAVYCVTPIIAHHSSLRSCWLIVSWSVVDHSRTWRLIQIERPIIGHIPTLCMFWWVLTFDLSMFLTNGFIFHGNKIEIVKKKKKKWSANEIFLVLTEVQSSMIILTSCKFWHTPSVTTPYSLYRFITELDDEINGAI